MTGKELLYVEDALGHIQHIKTICETYSRNLQDPNLKAFVETLRQRNQELETKFLNYFYLILLIINLHIKLENATLLFSLKPSIKSA